jgi:hypothetical protein
MSELQWLIHMLTKQKLPNALKDLFIERIGEVEALLTKPSIRIPPSALVNPSQAPSTQRILDGIAQTPAAAAALESRDAAIRAAASAKPEPGRTSPRKF